MIAHIRGPISEKNPSCVVIDCHGVGYSLQISLHTYEKIGTSTEVKLLTYLSIKEDSHTLFGFADEEERQLFLQLVSVNGVGAGTARMMLSSMKPAEVKHAISSGNWNLLKTIKGIGPKTAQRIVIDLQDKVKQLTMAPAGGGSGGSAVMQEALSALLALGFARGDAEKALLKMKQSNPGMTVEELVKQTLKTL